MTFPLTLIFIFLVFWRPQEWLFPWMFGWPVLQGIVFFAGLGLFVEYNGGKTGMRIGPAVMLAIGLWFATLMSHIAHFYYAGLVVTLEDTYKISLLLILILMTVNSIDRIRAVVLILIAAAVLIAVNVIMQIKTGSGLGGTVPMWDYSKSKDMWFQRGLFVGIFSDPNDTAQFLATAMPLVFAYPKRLSTINFIICCGIAALMIMGIDGTYSRGGLIAAIVVVSTILFMRLPARWLPYVAVVALIGGLFLFLTQGGALMDLSARERVVFWGYGNEAFKHNPLFGIGYNMFPEISGDRAAHNAFVACYTELGLFGYWFWFVLIMLGFVGCWRVRVAFKRPNNGVEAYLKRLAGMSIASMAGFLAAGYFLSRAFVFPLFFLIGLLNVIPLVAQRYLPEGHPPLIDFKKDAIKTGTIATLFSVVYVYLSILALNKSYGG